jgi:preprotein translocase subunit SecG
MMRTILTILLVISSFVIVALVLLQRGKGADAGAGFGAGASGTVFGARGATTGLSRMTAIFAAVFMFVCLCLTYFMQREARARPESLLDKVPVSTTVPAPAPAAPIDANAVPVPAAPPAEQAPEKPGTKP